ncbi:MAG: DUF488 domain-containing protein [Gammaproteobacteria bacterium]
MKISIKRAYEDPAPADGYRVLVDRVWPRGRTKEVLAIDEWARELAPSTELRKWFGHDPDRWDDFQARYLAELEAPDQQERLRSVLAAAGKGPMTLVYGAKDEVHNQAVVLRGLLSQHAGKR